MRDLRKAMFRLRHPPQWGLEYYFEYWRWLGQNAFDFLAMYCNAPEGELTWFEVWGE